MTIRIRIKTDASFGDTIGRMRYVRPGCVPQSRSAWAIRLTASNSIKSLASFTTLAVPDWTVACSAQFGRGQNCMGFRVATENGGWCIRRLGTGGKQKLFGYCTLRPCATPASLLIVGLESRLRCDWDMRDG